MPIYALRIVSVVLTILYTLVTLSTCTVSPPAEPLEFTQAAAPLGQSNEIVAINIFQSRGDASIPLQKAADAYVAKHPGTQIRVHTVDGPAEYQSALRAKLLNGEQVDLFHLFGAQDLYQLEGYVSPLPDSMAWASQTYDFLVAPVRDDAAVYGVPYSLEGVGLVANRSIFDAADISLDGIRTFEDLTDAFAELRGKIDSGELREEFPQLEYVTEFPVLDRAFTGEQLLNIALTHSFATPQQAAGAKLIDLISSEAFEEYVKLMARYSSSRGDWGGLNFVSQMQQVEYGLAAGRVAIIQQSVGVCRTIYKVNPDISADLVLLPIPLSENPEESGVYAGAPCYWAINALSDPEAANLAQSFLTWLYQSEEGQLLLFEDFSVLSPYTSSGENTGISLYTQLLRYIGQESYRPYLHSEVPLGWAGDVFVQGLRDYLDSDTLDWNSFIDDAQAAWGKLRQTA